MSIQAVTLDCAGTLLQVHWRVESFAVDAARFIGFDLPPEAAALYKEMYVRRLPEFLELNLRRDPSAVDEFYRQLNGDWLERLEVDRDRAIDLGTAADELAFGPNSELFRLFDDTLSALQALRESGLKLAVVSNWDYTLHRVLEKFAISPLLEFALASLEEGVEKPHPRLFEIALGRLGCSPSEVLHVGDDPLDDFEGATGAGIHAALLDRSKEPDLPKRIASLTEIPEAIACLS